jgi:hypothetical protein
VQNQEIGQNVTFGQTGAYGRLDAKIDEKSAKSDLHGTLKPEMLRDPEVDFFLLAPERSTSQDAWAHVFFSPMSPQVHPVARNTTFGAKTLTPIKSEPEVVRTGRFERHTGAL